VEKSQFDLCLNVLRKFDSAGILDDIVLIGSWCVVFYRYYDPTARMDLPSLRTRDVDFLVPRPSRIKNIVDVPDLVKDLGFVVTRLSNGFIRLNHPDLIMEFLTPELGAGKEAPVPMPKLGINAVALRFLNFLTDDLIHVVVEDFSLTLPHPVPFALHKLIVSQRRTNKEKGKKDYMMAVGLLRPLIKNGDSDRIRKTFNSIPLPWKSKILKGLDSKEDRDILAVLEAGEKSRRTPLV
jgi:hypothetical protein